MFDDFLSQLRDRLRHSLQFRCPSQRKQSRQSRRKIDRLEERCLLSMVSVMAADPFAVEGESTGTFVFSRDGSLTGALALSYSVGGTATGGSDYQALNGSVTIPAGESSVSVAVVPIKDASVEGTESVSVTLGAVAGYSTDLGAATVSVRDAFDGA